MLKVPRNRQSDSTEREASMSDLSQDPSWYQQQAEQALEQVITERDEAEEAAGDFYHAITGKSPEWSNVFGYKEALEEIEAAKEQAEQENLKLREIISKSVAALGNGSAALPTCSLEFFANVPNEIRLTIQAKDQKARELEAALKDIATHKFVNYGVARDGIYEGQYGIGVVDGHRACASIARLALGHHDACTKGPCNCGYDLLKSQLTKHIEGGK